jgi:hypothetical protein
MLRVCVTGVHVEVVNDDQHLMCGVVPAEQLTLLWEFERSGIPEPMENTSFNISTVLAF